MDSQMKEVARHSLILNPKKIQCPKCLRKSTSGSEIFISIDKYKGDYCIECWTKWISENITKMEEINGKE